MQIDFWQDIWLPAIVGFITMFITIGAVVFFPNEKIVLEFRDSIHRWGFWLFASFAGSLTAIVNVGVTKPQNIILGSIFGGLFAFQLILYYGISQLQRMNELSTMKRGVLTERSLRLESFAGKIGIEISEDDQHNNYEEKTF